MISAKAPPAPLAPLALLLHSLAPLTGAELQHGMAWLTASNLRESRRHLYYNFCKEGTAKGGQGRELVINKLQLVKVAPGHVVQVLSLLGLLTILIPLSATQARH